MTARAKPRPCDNARRCAGAAVIIRWSSSRGKVVAWCLECDEADPG